MCAPELPFVEDADLDGPAFCRTCDEYHEPEVCPLDGYCDGCGYRNCICDLDCED